MTRLFYALFLTDAPLIVFRFFHAFCAGHLSCDPPRLVCALYASVVLAIPFVCIRMIVFRNHTLPLSCYPSSRGYSYNIHVSRFTLKFKPAIETLKGTHERTVTERFLFGPFRFHSPRRPLFFQQLFATQRRETIRHVRQTSKRAFRRVYCERASGTDASVSARESPI